ncbi:hypothetical protein GA0070616_1235 [Micromonospora nigra]|uniref:Uncharacterized protein n=1 Tax=Micromonospora nigra TaxID=145857 RepID=A0A1C6RJ89_9ACTN|nr:hypothetical protein [Micromonospora nigra]SCL17249.1 hypothetical protein GA0070616_1235 [Micromonospora nigra]
MSEHETEEHAVTADQSRPTSRRRVIRGAVVAGAGVGAAAAVATPARAAAGDPVLLDEANDAGTAETLLVGGSSAGPTLALDHAIDRSPLILSQTPAAALPEELPTGSLAIDESGDLVIGGRANTRAYVNTSRWANRTLAVPPRRVLDTRSINSWGDYVVGGAGNVDATGKLRAKTSIHLSISTLPEVEPGRALAAYVNVTVAGTVAGGFLTAHSASVATPGTSSLNWWGPNQILSNLVEVQLGAYGGRGFSFSIYTASATSVIVDVSGLILANPAAP